MGAGFHPWTSQHFSLDLSFDKGVLGA